MLIRDSQGTWIASVTVNLGKTSCISVEIWGEMNFHNILIEYWILLLLYSRLTQVYKMIICVLVLSKPIKH